MPEEQSDKNSQDKKAENQEDVNSESAIVNEEQSTINQEQSTEMEVHHHPDIHHKPKKWKEYFLEFLMIFLAVTMGFFAEQMRENFSENNREKQFMRSMVEDLKSDTANISSFTSKADEVLMQTDSLIHLMRNPDRNKYGQTMYYFARSITTKMGRFVLNDRTYEEMKSSGSLRLIDDNALSDSISKYYATQTAFKEQAGLQIQKMAAYTDFAGRVFDGAVFQQMLQRYPYKVNRPNGNPQLLTNDAETFNEFTGILHYFSAIIIINSSRAKQQNSLTIDLIKMIQKKYNLD
jgi:hypothetical protein